MHEFRPLLFSLLAFTAVLSAARAVPPLPTTKPAADPRRFAAEIAAFEAADRANPPPTNAVLFTGSSSIRLWKTLAQDFPEYVVINRGFGGCHVSDVVHYAERIVIPYRPRLIVLFAGTNDIHGGKRPEQVAADFRAFVLKVRAALPDVRIAYMSTTPAPVRWAEAPAQRRANELIRKLVAALPNLDYIDMFDAFLGPNGEPRPELYVADRLHNSPEGYAIRTALTRPHLAPPGAAPAVAPEPAAPPPATAEPPAQSDAPVAAPAPAPAPEAAP